MATKIIPYSKLSQEERDRMRRASQQMADAEYIMEVQNRLPESLRFGGEYGIMSALGYGKGDDRADITSYVPKNDRAILSILGQYMPEYAQDSYVQSNSADFSKVADYVSEPPKQGGIAVLLPTSAEKAQTMYREGTLERGDSPTPAGYNRTVAHELTHRGFSNPVVAAALRDFLDRTPLSEFSSDAKVYDVSNAKRILKNLNSTSQQHRFIDEIQPEVAEDRTAQRGGRDARLLDRIIRDFMSREENKQKYPDVYIPTRSAQREEPSIVDRIMSFIKG